MGLIPGNRSFLNSLGQSKIVYFDFPHGKLLINPENFIPPPNGQTIKMYIPDNGLRYPITKIVQFNGLTANGTNGRGTSIPNYAIFDTGTNSTIVPAKYYNTLINSIKKNGSSKVAMTFSNGSSTYSSNVTILLEMNNLVKGELPIDSTILIGAKSFDMYSVLFNYDIMEISFYHTS
jgi:hypothetical protein